MLIDSERNVGMLYLTRKSREVVEPDWYCLGTVDPLWQSSEGTRGAIEKKGMKNRKMRSRIMFNTRTISKLLKETADNKNLKDRRYKV